MSFLSPTVTSPAGTESGPGLIRLRNYVEYIHAIPQRVTASQCEMLGSSLVTCIVEFSDPLIEALGITASNASHEVTDGLLTFVTITSQYAQSDIVLANYVRSFDEEAFVAACVVPDDGSVWTEFGLAYNAECGAFVSLHVANAALEHRAPRQDLTPMQ